MRQEDLELNKLRIQVVRSQLRDFNETLQELETEVVSQGLKRRTKEHAQAIQLIRDRLCGVENFLELLHP